MRIILSERERERERQRQREGDRDIFSHFIFKYEDIVQRTQPQLDSLQVEILS